MKRSIYIIDDQQAVLETAVAIVRAMLPDTEVTGFNEPVKALAAIKANPPDMVLSDHVMPGMSGSLLLEAVRQSAPSALRIIMSGYVPLDKLTQITSAHQYVAKPFDARKLKQLLERTFAAHDRVPDRELQKVVTSLRSLPSLPQVHQTLLAELNSPEGAAASIGQIVSQDAGLSAKVLQLANSPLFGRQYLVTNPEHAVLCLGTSMIVAVVLSQSLFKSYQTNTHPEIVLSRLWNHCWETAALAQCYCGEQGLSRPAREEAFMAGLLHETGRLILIDNFPDQYQKACDAARKAGSPLEPRLREEFPASPSQIAAYLLDLWGMPTSVVTAVSMMEQPQAEKTTQFTPTAALYIANHVSSRENPPDAFPAEEWDPAYLRSIGCSEDIQQWTRHDGGLA